MTISSISNVYTAPQAYGIKNTYSATGTTQATAASASAISSNATGSNASSNSIDFTNMSPSEFNSLYKSGEFGADLPPIMLPKGGLDATKDTKQQMYAIQDQKFNYIDSIMHKIEFEKSIGTSTEQDNIVLSKMLALQGKSIPKQPELSLYA